MSHESNRTTLPNGDIKEEIVLESGRTLYLVESSENSREEELKERPFDWKKLPKNFLEKLIYTWRRCPHCWFSSGEIIRLVTINYNNGPVSACIFCDWNDIEE